MRKRLLALSVLLMALVTITWAQTSMRSVPLTLEAIEDGTITFNNAAIQYVQYSINGGDVKYIAPRENGSSERKVVNIQVTAGDVVTFTALHRISATGHKYWRMDWSVDGTTWTPVKPLETETETGTSAQYTHIAPTGDEEISESFTLPAVADGTLRIRFTCVANWQGNGKGALAAPNGGTHRWSGTAETGPKITITKP